MTVAVSNRIRDLESVLHTTEEHSLTQLNEVAMDIDSWQTKARSSNLTSDLQPLHAERDSLPSYMHQATTVYMYLHYKLCVCVCVCVCRCAR